ncbi:hypothetical protein ANANG_G00053830 [Anguilla anguilla]|uniref:Uncharacterized protein n=1 Tax=Anguilla anguilla TaxID=7936 RepID=A0A9D3MMY5_ANGAN|nr:hypothetical protein ANANG_G00053830 [Anguilla anguilla]
MESVIRVPETQEWESLVRWRTGPAEVEIASEGHSPDQPDSSAIFSTEVQGGARRHREAQGGAGIQWEPIITGTRVETGSCVGVA